MPQTFRLVRRKGKRGIKRYRRMRVPRSIVAYKRSVTNHLRTQRTFWVSNWVPGTATTNDFWRYYQFQLQLLPGYTEYTGIFDQYKVNSFSIILRPRYDSFAGNDTTDTVLPAVTNQGGNHVHVIIDPSSIVSPSGAYSSANLNAFLENGKVRTYSGNRAITIKCKYPMFIDDVNTTPLTDFERSRWFNTNAIGVNLRGIHMFIQDVNLTGVFGQSYDVFYNVDISFKGMR